MRTGVKRSRAKFPTISFEAKSQQRLAPIVAIIAPLVTRKARIFDRAGCMRAVAFRTQAFSVGIGQAAR
jgi:hypothetical protein